MEEHERDGWGRQDFPPWRIQDVFYVTCLFWVSELGIKSLIEGLWFRNVPLSRFDNSLDKVLQVLALATLGQRTAISIVLFVAVIYVVRCRHRLSLAGIGWSLQISREWLCSAFLIGIADGVLSFFLIIWISDGLPAGWKFTDSNGNPMIPVISVYLIVSGIQAPIIEELFFRGFCYTAFRKHLGTSVGILLSSIHFILCHYNILNLPALTLALFLSNVILCMAYEKTKSLVPSIVIHSTMNTMILICSWISDQV